MSGTHLVRIVHHVVKAVGLERKLGKERSDRSVVVDLDAEVLRDGRTNLVLRGWWKRRLGGQFGPAFGKAWRSRGGGTYLSRRPRC